MTVLVNIVSWLEHHSAPCLFKKLTGFACPGCGTQRAVIELLKGNLLNSIKEWPALLPVAFMMIYLMLFLIFRFKNGLKILQISFIINAIIILINYIYKLFL